MSGTFWWIDLVRLPYTHRATLSLCLLKLDKGRQCDEKACASR